MQNPEDFMPLTPIPEVPTMAELTQAVQEIQVRLNQVQTLLGEIHAELS